MIAAPAFSAAAAVAAWVVSMLTRAPALTRASMTGRTRRCSSSALTSVGAGAGGFPADVDDVRAGVEHPQARRRWRCPPSRAARRR